MASDGVAVTGWSLHLPGADLTDFVPGVTGHAVPPEAAHQLLGRKGLLGKEPATRLALCATHSALGLPARAPRPEGPADPRTGVVVSSNLGNLATVVDVVRTVRATSSRDVSPLAAPNASSNVIASTLAIWFRFGGPNLMLCSGATAGLDAVAMASLMLRAGRADRMVVVGAEPADGVASAIHASRGWSIERAAPLRSGAACLILEPAGVAPTAPLIGAVRTAMDEPATDAECYELVVGPVGATADTGRRLDLVASLGDLYGALGVAQSAVAAALIGSGAVTAAVRVVCGDEVDGWRTLDVLPR